MGATGKVSFTMPDKNSVLKVEYELKNATSTEPENENQQNGSSDKKGCSKESVGLALAMFMALISCVFIIKK